MIPIVKQIFANTSVFLPYKVKSHMNKIYSSATYLLYSTQNSDFLQLSTCWIPMDISLEHFPVKMFLLFGDQFGLISSSCH